MSLLSSMLCERQVLCCLVDNIELMANLDRNYFVSDEGAALYDALKILYTAHVTPTITNMVSEGNKRHGKLTEDSIQSLLETDRDTGSFAYYFQRLRGDYAKAQIETSLLEKIWTKTSSKGELDVALLQNWVYDLQGHLDTAVGKASSVQTPEQFMDAYLRQIEARNQGLYKWEFGDSSLDQALAVGPAPGEITSIFGATGMGKSMLSLNLFNRMINCRIPCGMISLEMSGVATGDRLMGLRKDLDSRLIFPRSKGEPLDDFVIEAIRRERETLANKLNHWFFVDEPSLSIADIEAIIRRQQIAMKTKYFILFIDLFSMLKDVSGEDPSVIEKGMNMIHEVARKTGIHVVLLIQANRATDNTKPLNIQGIQRLRPTLNNIKNSSAIAERSRIVLGIFREKYYADRLFPDDEEARALDDIVEVQVLKQSMGSVGQLVRYFHEPGLFKLMKISPEELVEAQARRRRILGEEQPAQDGAPAT